MDLVDNVLGTCQDLFMTRRERLVTRRYVDFLRFVGGICQH